MRSSGAEAVGLKDIRGILWDLDGTLQDSYNLILHSFRYATRTVLGRVIPDDELMAKVGQPLAVQMWDWTDDDAVHQRLLDVYREHNHRTHDEALREFPGVREALARLYEAGFRMGVVTSKFHELARRGLEVVGAAPYMDVLVGADDCTEHKPAPGAVLYGCSLLGIDPSACVYVGDSPFDIAAGNAAGCTTIAALWGMFPRADLEAEHPAYLAQSITQVADMLCPR